MLGQSFAFAKLKQPCVDLAQAALEASASRSDGKQVIVRLHDLLRTLQEITSQPDALNPRLAEYGFFPISQVLKIARQLPIQAIELSLQCLSLLILHGWRDQVSPSMCSQLIILLAFMADGSQDKPQSPKPTDELRYNAFVCLDHLFTVIQTNSTTSASLTSLANVPSLGHAVTVLLEGISSADSPRTQLVAATALQALVHCITEQEALATFLPGLVSTLTKVLTPSTRTRRSWRLLVAAVTIMRNVLRRTVSDLFTVVIRNERSPVSAQTINASSSHLDKAWLTASAGQIKLAIASVNRLYSHERQEVRDSLLDLNFMIVVECIESLPDCRQLALETAIVLVEHGGNDEARRRLLGVVNNDEHIAQSLQSTFRNWTMSMNRIMASADDRNKETKLLRTFSVFSLLGESGNASPMSDQMMASMLQESVMTLIRLPSKTKDAVQDLGNLTINGLPIQALTTSRTHFDSRMAQSTSQQLVLDVIRTHISALALGSSAIAITNILVQSLVEYDTDTQITTLWLLLGMLQRRSPDVIDDYTCVTDSSSRELEVIMNEVYSTALVLVAEDELDWRLYALALEALALQAQRSGQAFRGELIDTLYPVLFHLGSRIPQVRDNAIICLDIMAKSCEYSNVKELIVSNVDYLVNAVALKLNAFELSPQSPQVLLMMVKLAGPTLLPYLEDTIDSIFAALEDYHGYPALVELLFAVLKAMAEEGVKAPHFAITTGVNKADRPAHEWSPMSTSDLAKLLRATLEASRPESLRLNDTDEKFDFKDLVPPADDEAKIPDDDEPLDMNNIDGTIPDNVPADPAPKLSTSYNLLHKMTQLTQHYLSSSSPSLRISLLSLINTTSPALATGDENTYLPLVNTLWPELVSRLADSELAVVAASLETINIMCAHAEEFMRSRVRDTWDDIRKLHRRTTAVTRRAGQTELVGSQVIKSTVGVGYVDTGARAVWKGLRGLLLTVVKHVGADAGMFDEILDMLAPLGGLDADARAVLERENADAVWLALGKEGIWSGVERLPRPSDGREWAFVPVAS